MEPTDCTGARDRLAGGGVPFDSDLCHSGSSTRRAKTGLRYRRKPALSKSVRATVKMPMGANDRTFCQSGWLSGFQTADLNWGRYVVDSD